MSSYSMVQECTNQYEIRDRPDGSAEIVIRVPARYRNLWRDKLSALRASDEELREHDRLQDHRGE